MLLDLRMPGIDGLDVLSTMVNEAPETPVVVASGAGTMRDAVEALRRGAWDFVTKPMYDPELLVRSLGRAIEKAHLKRQNEEYRLNLERANEVLARALGELRADQQGARLLQFQLLPRDGLPLGPHRVPAHLPLGGPQRRLRGLLPAGRAACGVLRGGRVGARRRLGLRDRHPDHPGGKVPPGPGAGGGRTVLDQGNCWAGCTPTCPRCPWKST